MNENYYQKINNLKIYSRLHFLKFGGFVLEMITIYEQNELIIEFLEECVCGVILETNTEQIILSSTEAMEKINMHNIMHIVQNESDELEIFYFEDYIKLIAL